jgi:two-component system chemotaxis sensor kinase CheA
LEDFWGSLIHVVRNAVDHGLESEEERVARGKPAMGSVVLRTSQLSGSGFCIELSDDGRGIDFNALRAIATQRGVAATSNSELIELMFHDGVTTKEQASEMSGRGVGLGAVVSACRAAGGMVDVDTSEGKGSLFRFAFPDQPVQVREAKGSGTFHSMTPRRSVRASLRSATNT